MSEWTADYLADIEAQIIDHIRTSVTERGYPPSLAEIGKQVDKSKSTVHRHVARLVEKGVIARGGRYQPRMLRLTEGAEENE